VISAATLVPEYEVPFVGSGFDETFMSTALAQAEGKISAPVQTQFGFHIIKTISKTNYPVKKFEDVKEEIKKTLLDQEKQTKYTDTMTKWRTDAKIKTYEENL
jgi:foldase protein PrsA